MLKCCKPICLSLLFVVSFAAPPLVRADEVVLSNGDRLSGVIVGKEGETLVLKVDYAGEVKIRWSEVRRIASDAPKWVYLEDGSRLNGRLEMADDGTAVVDAGESLRSGPVALSTIRFINPSPLVSGEGAKLTGRINSGLSSSSGNTETETFYLGAEAVARTRDNRYTLGGQAKRADDRGQRTESNWLAYMKYDHFLAKKKWYVYANGSFENDKFNDIRLRSTIGVGSGYQFLESEKTNLSFEGGLTYVSTDFNLGQDEDFPAGRWALKFDHYLFGSRTQFFHFHETHVGLEDAQNAFVRSQTGLRFPLVPRLNATAQYDVDWDNDPAPGRVGTDKTLLLTLGYHW